MVKKCPGISKAFPAADTATGGTVVRRDPRTRDSTLRAGSGRNHENPFAHTHTHAALYVFQHVYCASEGHVFLADR